MITPARSHDTSDAPPADVAAVNAPSNQPDPMIEPNETNISAIKPTSRRNPGWAPDVSLRSDTRAMITIPFGGKPDSQQYPLDGWNPGRPRGATPDILGSEYVDCCVA
jgi:hypothetical protein